MTFEKQTVFKFNQWNLKDLPLKNESETLAHASTLSTWEAEAGGLSEVPGQNFLHRKANDHLRTTEQQNKENILISILCFVHFSQITEIAF